MFYPFDCLKVTYLLLQAFIPLFVLIFYAIIIKLRQFSMGNSITEEQIKPLQKVSPAVQARPAPKDKKIQISQMHNDLPTIDIQDQHKKILPEKIKNQEARKSLETNQNPLNIVKKQLPPIKKVKSVKRFDEVSVIQKQNRQSENKQKYLVTRVNCQRREVSGRQVSEVTISQMRQDEPVEYKHPHRQSKLKKIRISKQLNLNHGAYF